MASESLEIKRVSALAIVTIKSVQRPNYLVEALLTDLAAAFDQLMADSSVKSMCLAGRSDGFLLGIDPKFFTNCLLENNLETILSFTRRAHLLLARIERSTKPLVAWVAGPALGAGLELALACNSIVASPAAKFALPETGLGIYPGMGGTQRTPRRVGLGLAKWMIYTGSILPADHALEIGLIDAVVPGGADPIEAISRLASGPRRATSPIVSTRFRALEELFGRHDVATLCNPAFPLPTEPQAVRALVQMRLKAPLALRLAEQIVDRGATLPLPAAIDEEFSHLAEVFSTEDARIGLASVGKQPPKFVGR